MSRLEEVEKTVEAMTPQELASFREWFARFDEAAWDDKFELDASSRRLDGLPVAALSAHRAGKSRELHQWDQLD